MWGTSRSGLSGPWDLCVAAKLKTNFVAKVSQDIPETGKKCKFCRRFSNIPKKRNLPLTYFMLLIPHVGCSNLCFYSDCETHHPITPPGTSLRMSCSFFSQAVFPSRIGQKSCLVHEDFPRVMLIALPCLCKLFACAWPECWWMCIVCAFVCMCLVVWIHGLRAVASAFKPPVSLVALFKQHSLSGACYAGRLARFLACCLHHIIAWSSHLLCPCAVLAFLKFPVGVQDLWARYAAA